MSLTESYRQLRDGLVEKSGLSPAAARRAATAFFVITAGVLAALFVGAVVLAVTDPSASGPARTVGILVPVALVLGVGIASLGERLTPFPTWLKWFMAAGLAAAFLLGRFTAHGVAALWLVLAVGGIVLAVGLRR